MSVLEAEAALNPRKIDDGDMHGDKPIPDPKSPELEFTTDIESEWTDVTQLRIKIRGTGNLTNPKFPELESMSVLEEEAALNPRKIDDGDMHGDKPIPDPKSPELKFTTDSESEWTDASDVESSDMDEVVGEPDDQIDGDTQIDSGKQMVTDEGESQTTCTKPRKRKASCCICHRRLRPAKTRKRSVPDGFGYVPSASYVDENGVFQPVFTHQVAYMRCYRCGIHGDHWEPFCLNPINDPPETDEEAAEGKFSWKYLLRNFNAKEYLEKHKTQGKLQPSSSMAGISNSSASLKCFYCRNQTHAKTEKPPLPDGFGYVPSASYVDEKGVFQPVFTHQVAYMRCYRCGINGDHWEPFCLNPINDPPETDEEAAEGKFSWKYLLRNFNPKEYLEKHKQEPECDPPRLKSVKSIGPLSRRARFRPLGYS